MIGRVVIAFVVVSAAAACGGKGKATTMGSREGGEVRPVAAGMPEEVDALVARWESCQHWAGEEPYDEERRREIEAGVAASCPGNEERRAALLEKYADRTDVVARLRALEE